MIVQIWHYHAPRTRRGLVLPDGCRDVLVRLRPGHAPELSLTPLQAVPDRPLLTTGTRLTGFRLAPGQRITRLAPLREALSRSAAGPKDLAPLIDALTQRCARLDAAIACLGQAASVAMAARDLGVSEATLQRLFHRQEQPPPAFWLQLARARRAAAGLADPTLALADLACDAGYADQPHMTRQFQRFFDHTPGQIRRGTALQAQFRYPALATGEQISTSVPSGSAT